MSELLTFEQVSHLAKLSRLRLSDEQIQTYRSQLTSILEHMDRLNAVDVEGVEPMAHPLDLTNRLDEDEVADAMDLSKLLVNAPASEGPYLVVPKVLDGEGDSS